MAQRGNPQKGGQTAIETPNVSAAELQKYLKGVNYPAEKQDLADAAENNGAPDNVLDMINSLDDKTFNSSTEVEQAFAKAQGSTMTHDSSKAQEYSKTTK